MENIDGVGSIGLVKDGLIGFDQGDERTTKVKGHDFIGGTNELATYEDSWHCRGTADTEESLLDFAAVWIVVDLVDHWLNPKVTEQDLNGIAETTGAFRQDHHSFL
ncbi:unnamed protein product [Eruca vesicaria subsp. sativa]|uniref:Uncharacterized protein n=1 Tax=Eruca vesicaria subsp. sativa TaxID=29727 RepID=A0ABC8L0N8_ERUVS|nr:unnamed protein product [Eruca vesicaria subsp. sativa]